MLYESLCGMALFSMKVQMSKALKTFSEFLHLPLIRNSSIWNCSVDRNNIIPSQKALGKELNVLCGQLY